MSLRNLSMTHKCARKRYTIPLNMRPLSGPYLPRLLRYWIFHFARILDKTSDHGKTTSPYERVVALSTFIHIV